MGIWETWNGIADAAGKHSQKQTCFDTLNLTMSPWIPDNNVPPFGMCWSCDKSTAPLGWLGWLGLIASSSFHLYLISTISNFHRPNSSILSLLPTSGRKFGGQMYIEQVGLPCSSLLRYQVLSQMLLCKMKKVFFSPNIAVPAPNVIPVGNTKRKPIDFEHHVCTY